MVDSALSHEKRGTNVVPIVLSFMCIAMFWREENIFNRLLLVFVLGAIAMCFNWEGTRFDTRIRKMQEMMKMDTEKIIQSRVAREEEEEEENSKT